MNTQFSLQPDTNGPLCRFLDLCFCVAPFSRVLCTAKSRFPSLLELWSSSPQLYKTSTLHFSFLCWNLINSSRRKLGIIGFTSFISPSITVLRCLSSALWIRCLQWKERSSSSYYSLMAGNGTLHPFNLIFSIHGPFPKSFNTDRLNHISLWLWCCFRW